MDWAQLAFIAGAFVLGCLLGEAGSPADASDDAYDAPERPEKPDRFIPLEEILDDAMFDVVYVAGELAVCPHCQEQVHIHGHTIKQVGMQAIVDLDVYCPGCDQELHWPLSGEWASAVLAKQLWDQVQIAQEVIDLENGGTLSM